LLTTARARLGALLAALMTACLVAGVPAATAATPDKDPFYTASSSTAAPGTIVRSRSAKFTLDPFFKLATPGIKSTQVIYASETGQGAPINISGTVLVPTARWRGAGDRPVVTYGVGTRGVGDACAPSYTLSQGTDYEGLFIYAALQRGWAVAVSDMRGLGTPGQHTYEVGRDQGKALLDMARAAERLPGSGLNAGSPVGIMGYSQGGTSAGWATELAPSYAPELNLKGTAAGGVPADLLAVAKGLDGGPFVAFAFMASMGYDAAYPELNLASYLNAKGRDLLTRSQNVCLVSVDGIGTFLGTAFKKISDYVTTNPLDTPQWQARLNENKLGSVKPTVPVFQYHGQIDEIIPFTQADTLHKQWCALGANVTWRTYPLAEHLLGMVVGSGPAMDFMSDRFAGKPVSGNC
jgi:hypothetical protein